MLVPPLTIFYGKIGHYVSEGKKNIRFYKDKKDKKNVRVKNPRAASITQK